MKENFYIEGLHVQPNLNKVSSKDEEWKIEPKIMEVLVILARNHGKVVSKENLLNEVWNGTFVVDMVVTRAISELRGVFKQGLNGTRIIETIPKRGYRIVANVRFNKKRSLPKLKSPIFAVVVFMVLGYLGYRYIIFENKPVDTKSKIRVKPFTTYSGLEYDAKISSDGRFVVFIWRDVDDPKPFKLCVKATEGELNKVITASVNPMFSPIWSKDGNNILYYKNVDGHASIYMIPTFGGKEKKLIDTKARVAGISLHKGGSILAYVDNDTLRNQSLIKTIDLNTKEIETTTFPKKNIWGDAVPRFSPSGNCLAYIRTVSEGNQDIYIVDRKTKTEEKITSFENNIIGYDWLDEENLIFSANLDKSTYSLWRINIPTKGFEKTQACINCHHPTVSKGKMVYEHWIQDVDLWKYHLSEDIDATPLITSSMYDIHPDLNPEMDSLVFVSDRSGKFELWTTDLDGHEFNRIVNNNYTYVGNPKWAPNNKFIAYEARKEGGHSLIHLLDSDKNSFELSEKEYDAMFPSWSNDGDFIYYTSDKDGEWQIWKKSLGGLDSEKKITLKGGYYSQESEDGKNLYYSKINKSGIWQLDMSNGHELKIIDSLGTDDYSNWKVTSKGIYFLKRGNTNNSSEIAFYNFNNKSERTIFKPTKEVPTKDNSFTIARDNKTIIYGQSKGFGGDLLLMENF
ncbi:winged helix-turn-helix domain-containing protein [Flavobacteriaceae bacterium 3-367]